MSPLDPDLVIALDKMMRSDLDAWSSLWFWILVGSTIVVAFGIIAEAPEVWKEVGLGRETIARIRKWWYIRVRRIELNGWETLCPELVSKNDFRRGWIIKAACIGWLLVAVGVLGEGIAEYFVNDAETGIRAFEEARVAEVTKQAGDAATSATIAHEEADAVKGIADEARADAKDALTKAKAAQHELARAEADAGKAQAASSNALMNAEAANKQATEANALASEAQAELRRIVSYRRLSPSPQLVAALTTFKDVEYVFDGVAGDAEAVQLLLDIDTLLKSAGWKRAKSLEVALGIPDIRPNGDIDPDLKVPMSLMIGVQITVDSTLTEGFLRSTSIALWPKYVQAASKLHEAIFLNTSPTPRPSDPHFFTLKKGTSAVIAINVGRKP